MCWTYYLLIWVYGFWWAVVVLGGSGHSIFSLEWWVVVVVSWAWARRLSVVVCGCSIFLFSVSGGGVGVSVGCLVVTLVGLALCAWAFTLFYSGYPLCVYLLW
jgi:hypothetical protein